MTPQSYCLDQVSRWDRARGLALRYAPVAAREPGMAVLAFNLELAKVLPLVSEPALADIRFMWWQEALDELATGQEGRNHPVVQALASAQRPLLWQHLTGLLDGWRSVSRQQQLGTWSELNSNLEATHGRLAAALLSLGGGGDPQHPLSKDYAFSMAYARAWGYASLRQAVLEQGDLSLMPLAHQVASSGDGGTSRDQVLQAAEVLGAQGAQAFQELQGLWPALSPQGQGLMASAHLIPARLRDVERAQALAAWTLFKGHWRSKFAGL